MFVPRKLKPSKPQKRRSWSTTSAAVFASCGFDRWPGIFAINAGYMALRLVEYVYIWLKKVTRYPVSLVRFWVNLQAGIQVTRKPENVRMGKGKGARKGMQARVRAGSFLFKITSIRRGLLHFFLKKLQVRVAFKLGTRAHGEHLGFWGMPYTWVQHHLIQKKYVVRQLDLYKGLLKKMHRPLILGYILRIFWWRYVVPHAVWSPVKVAFGGSKLRRKYLRRRKILTYAKPQGMGFVRQLRLKYCQYLQIKQRFDLPVWRRAQVRWARSIKNARLFANTPSLPWDVLLRAKHFKRMLLYVNFIAFLPLVQGFLSKGGDVWFPLRLQAGEVLPVRIKTLSLAQLRVVVLVSYWRTVIGRGINFSILL